MSHPSSDAPIWLPLEVADLDAVDRIGRAIHPGLPERPEVFAEKRALFPEGALKAVGAGTMLGYGLAHPWRLGAIPALDAFLGTLPADADCLYVHDVALLEAARGHGLAGSFVAAMRAVARARGLAALACASVYGTTVLWSRYGFETVDDPNLAGKLAGYGDTARYMVARL